MSLRILVTGSSGFVGSVLTSALTKAGHRVRAASRRRTATADAARVGWMELPDLEQEVDWAPLLQGIDIVVHLAAIAHRSHRDSGDYARANLIATASLVRACAEQGIKRLIFMSSIGAQAGSAADHIVTEKDEPGPITAYDRAKLAAEEEIRRSGVPFTILRPVIVCLDNPEAINRTFIVCDPEPITLSEMLVTLREAAGRPPNLIPVPPVAVRALVIAAGRQALWDRIGRELVASSANLQKVGWSPQVETRAGLRAMVRASTSPPRDDSR